MIRQIVGAASIKEAVTVGGNAALTSGKKTEITKTSTGARAPVGGWGMYSSPAVLNQSIFRQDTIVDAHTRLKFNPRAFKIKGL